MGDVWSGETNYDRRRREKAAEEANRQKDREVRANSTLTGNQGSILSGTGAEQEGQIAGLNVGNIGYGQGLQETGQDIQRVKDLQRQRSDLSGADPVSAAIMNQKAGAMSGAQRGLASSGVKGGTAMGAIDAVGRQQDSNIAASLYGQQRQSIADERSLAGNMLAGQTSLMQGERAVGTTGSMPQAAQSSGMSVICTELYKQGYMDLALYMIDTHYGVSIGLRKPHVIVGYHFWGRPVAKLMAKSPIFAKLISIPAMAWARNMAGDKNLLGAFISFVGEPICGIIGKLISISSGEVHERI